MRVKRAIYYATYRAARRGYPLSRDRWLSRPMSHEDSMRIAELVERLAIDRRKGVK